MDIKEVIKQFKEENGNDTFTNKDFLIYLVQRVDNLPCDSQISKISKMDGKLRMLLWGFPIGLSIIGILLGIIIFYA